MNQGFILKKYLQENGITQTELAERLGITRAAVNRFVNTKKFQRTTLDKILKALDIDLKDLMGNDYEYSAREYLAQLSDNMKEIRTELKILRSLFIQIKSDIKDLKTSVSKES